jgi:hypothetical protein
MKSYWYSKLLKLESRKKQILAGRIFTGSSGSFVGLRKGSFCSFSSASISIPRRLSTKPTVENLLISAFASSTVVLKELRA